MGSGGAVQHVIELAMVPNASACVKNSLFASQTVADVINMPFVVKRYLSRRLGEDGTRFERSAVTAVTPPRDRARR